MFIMYDTCTYHTKRKILQYGHLNAGNPPREKTGRKQEMGGLIVQSGIKSVGSQIQAFTDVFFHASVVFTFDRVCNSCCLFSTDRAEDMYINTNLTKPSVTARIIGKGIFKISFGSSYSIKSCMGWGCVCLAFKSRFNRWLPTKESLTERSKMEKVFNMLPC